MCFHLRVLCNFYEKYENFNNMKWFSISWSYVTVCPIYLWRKLHFPWIFLFVSKHIYLLSYSLYWCRYLKILLLCDFLINSGLLEASLLVLLWTLNYAFIIQYYFNLQYYSYHYNSVCVINFIISFIDNINASNQITTIPNSFTFPSFS